MDVNVHILNRFDMWYIPVGTAVLAPGQHARADADLQSHPTPGEARQRVRMIRTSCDACRPTGRCVFDVLWGVVRWEGLLAAGLLAFAAHPSYAQQQAAIQGIIAETNTGRPLQDVAVTLEAGGKVTYGVFTNEHGVYRLNGVQPGTYTLRSKLIGYESHTQKVTLKAGQRLTVSFRVKQAPVALQGMVVRPQQGAAVKQLGREVVTPREIRAVPVPGGSGDLASYLQTLPGVVTTGDRGGQLYVRGGLPAGNEVLVDGIPIFEPFHILSFFSVFPEDLVSSADFYAGGFGARYHGRTSSVLDVHLREGDPNGFRTTASASPFLASAVVEGPAGGATWLASVRHSLIQQTSPSLLGTPEPVSFQSELLKMTSGHDYRCSLLAMHTSDRGQIDPQVKQSYVSWNNKLVGLKCVTLRPNGQRVEANWSYSGSSSAAVTYGASKLTSSIWRVQNDTHASDVFGGIPVEGGYEVYVQVMDYDLSDLFADQAKKSDGIFGASVYGEAELPIGSNLDVKPGVVLVAAPYSGVEPRLRASWTPFGTSGGTLQGALGIYRQSVVGTSDMRDVGSVFTAWMSAPDGKPLQALQAILGWQQSLGGGFNGSVEGYYKDLKNIPVPVWQSVAEFTTTLGRADGTVYGADARIELTRPHFYGFIGYGYNWTLYRAAQAAFADWFGQPVQSYHPAHDRRNQVNALATVDLGQFKLSARWQFGSGLPYTQPLGFDEGFDFSNGLYDVHKDLGTTRLVLNKPFTARMPAVHRLDVSIERYFDLSAGRLTLQAGAVNAYDRRNMFYYDLFTGHRLDQLPLAPYLSVTFKSR